MVIREGWEHWGHWGHWGHWWGGGIGVVIRVGWGQWGHWGGDKGGMGIMGTLVGGGIGVEMLG